MNIMMKRRRFNIIASLFLFNLIMVSCATNKVIYKDNNVRVITVERELPFPIDTIWEKIFMDFGGAHKFNTGVLMSDYVGDLKEAKVGAQRFMQQDDAGKKVLYERIEEIDKVHHSMRFKIYDAKGVPINTDVTYGVSQLVSLDSNKTLFKINFYYQTTPKFLATFANSSLEEDFINMTICIQHYLATGEVISKNNLNKVIEKYE